MNYIDVDYSGAQNSDGTAMEYGTVQAIKKSIVFYLTSQQGDYIKNPGRGGFLERLLFKSHNFSFTDAFNHELRLDLEQNFGKLVSFLNISIVPIYESKYWEVNIQYIINSTNYSDDIQLYYKGIKEFTQNEFIPIEYVDKNLEIFVTTNLVAMGNQKLVLNTELMKWVWGTKYVFVNFDEYSSNFQLISNMINNF